MPSSRHVALFFVGMLLLVSLACDLSFGNPADTVATAEAAARVAGSAAQTAAAQAGDLAGTAAALATTEGSEAIATVMAVATPHVDFLKEKLSNIEPDADGNYRATLSEDEVNTVLRLRQLLTGDLIGAKIQSQQVSFVEGSITLTGSIVEPLPGEILVSMRPTVVAGRFQLDIEDASVAGQEAPPQVLKAADDAINNSLGEALENLPAGVQLQDIIVGDGELTIIGRKSDGD